MQFTHIREIYFSPAGTTKTIVSEIARAFEGDHVVTDLLRDPVPDGLEVGEDELVIIGMPVFAGRIPSVCVDALARIKGHRSPAIVSVAYGNRAYDDALLELQELAEQSGFVVIGSGAFVTQHSLIPTVAHGRPDADDMKLIARFAEECKKKMEASVKGEPVRPNPKGKKPYVSPKALPMAPAADSGCTRCGICVSVCPAKAISADHPERTNKKKCIACVACVAACPQRSRRFSGPLYWMAEKILAVMWGKRREPETFL